MLFYKLYFKILIYNYFTSILPACMSAYHMCAGAQVNQKRVLDPLDLELQMVVRYHVGSGNQTCILWNGSHTLNC